MSKADGRTGEVHGRLTVLGRAERVNYWRCRCECGTEKDIANASLWAGTKSCGCLRREVVAAKNRTHGQSRSSTYQSWQAMRRRCADPKFRVYPYYGGRGIRVCERWESFVELRADMGERPAGASLGRIDNDGDYEPGNCRWETWTEQQRNRRSNHLLTFDGETLTIAEWAARTGIAARTIERRINRSGWSVEDALTF